MMAWLAAIARNEIRDQARRSRRKRRDAARNVTLSEGLEKAESRIRSEVSRLDLERRVLQLERALEELDPDRREVIILRRYEELTFPEIARRMNRSADACRVLHARAMVELTQRMKELESTPGD